MNAGLILSTNPDLWIQTPNDYGEKYCYEGWTICGNIFRPRALGIARHGACGTTSASAMRVILVSTAPMYARMTLATSTTLGTRKFASSAITVVNATVTPASVVNSLHLECHAVNMTVSMTAMVTVCVTMAETTPATEFVNASPWTVDLHIQVLTVRFRFVRIIRRTRRMPRATIEVSVSMEPVCAILASVIALSTWAESRRGACMGFVFLTLT